MRSEGSHWSASVRKSQSCAMPPGFATKNAETDRCGTKTRVSTMESGVARVRDQGAQPGRGGDAEVDPQCFAIFPVDPDSGGKVAAPHFRSYEVTDRFIVIGLDGQGRSRGHGGVFMVSAGEGFMRDPSQAVKPGMPQAFLLLQDEVVVPARQQIAGWQLAQKSGNASTPVPLIGDFEHLTHSMEVDINGL